MRKNDYIEFTNRETLERMIVLVEKLYPYSSFEELYKNFDKVSLEYEDNETADPKDMEAYYSLAEQEKYGVLGIKVKVKK